MKYRFSLPGLVAGLLLMALAGGCSKKEPVKLIPVQGKVTLEGGTLITSGFVTYHPVEGIKAKAEKSTGEIKSDGTYKLTTGGREGVPEGQYKITVHPSMTGNSSTAPPFSTACTMEANTPLRLAVPAGQGYDLVLPK